MGSHIKGWQVMVKEKGIRGSRKGIAHVLQDEAKGLPPQTKICRIRPTRIKQLVERQFGRVPAGGWLEKVKVSP